MNRQLTPDIKVWILAAALGLAGLTALSPAPAGAAASSEATRSSRWAEEVADALKNQKAAPATAAPAGRGEPAGSDRGNGGSGGGQGGRSGGERGSDGKAGGGQGGGGNNGNGGGRGNGNGNGRGGRD